MDHSNLSLEELMETGTFKKFHKSIESVIESAEDVDLNMLNSSKYFEEAQRNIQQRCVVRLFLKT